MKVISSRDNPLLKHARKLMASAAERRDARETLLDGPHLVSAYVQKTKGARMVILVAKSRRDHGEIDSILAQATQAEVVLVEDGLFKALSPSDTPTGIVAVIPIPRDEPLERVNSLLLDAVQDPGNVGSMLRTARAAGFEQVFLSAGCADPWSPKCLRGGMGAHFDLSVQSEANIAEVLGKWTGMSVACDPHATDSVFDLRMTVPLAILMGAEGVGLTRELMNATTHRCRIPMHAGTESLNVGAAAAVVMYEYVRQMQSPDSINRDHHFRIGRLS